MKNLTQKQFKTMFSGLCCARCKNDFTIDSIDSIEKYGDIQICKLVCKKCGKDFGEVVFNYNRKSDKHLPLKVVEGPPPISYDDVIDAHKFIKDNL